MLPATIPTRSERKLIRWATKDALIPTASFQSCKRHILGFLPITRSPFTRFRAFGLGAFPHEVERKPEYELRLSRKGEVSKRPVTGNDAGRLALCKGDKALRLQA